MDSEYSSGSEYTIRILNVPGLHKVLKNAASQIFERVLNIRQVLNTPQF